MRMQFKDKHILITIHTSQEIMIFLLWSDSKPSLYKSSVCALEDKNISLCVDGLNAVFKSTSCLELPSEIASKVQPGKPFPL